MQQDNSLRWSDGSSVVYNKYGSIEQVTRRIDCGYVSAGYKLTPLSNEFDNVMLSKSPKTFQRPQKPRQGDQLIHRRYIHVYQIKSAIAELLGSFRCQVKIREGQADETAWSYTWQSVMMADVWWRRSGIGIG